MISTNLDAHYLWNDCIDMEVKFGHFPSHFTADSIYLLGTAIKFGSKWSILYSNNFLSYECRQDIVSLEFLNFRQNIIFKRREKSKD